MKPFHHALINNLIANITNFTVWFALTFWVFLETRSVFATGMIAGVFLVLTSASGIWLGSLVDHNRKKRVMIGSSIVSLAFYGVALAMYLTIPRATWTDISAPALWIFILVVMLGMIAGNVRNVALATLVTLLVPAEGRDKANGLVGMVSGLGFLVTSAISGFLIAWAGMGVTLALGLVLTIVAIVDMSFVRLDEPTTVASDEQPKRIDLRGTIAVIAAVPGLFALIFFATFNNLLGGVFMALMDPYGLSLMEVQQWGLLWAFVSCAFILSGLTIARFGLGRNPLRTLLLVNLGVWTVAAVFTLQSSIALLATGCFIWLFLGPFAEAAEQTTLQKVVPFERQGRVFGFAQSVELAASPLTAFLIGPLTQFWAIPLMTDGAGADAVGDWFGRGPERGMALVFTVAGLIGIVATAMAFKSRAYRLLSARYASGQTPEAP